MDVESIPRRERRHFRKYIDGEIVYSDVPFGNEEKHNYSKSNDFSSKNTVVKNLLDIDGKRKPIVHDDEKIQKVLQNISDIVAPDLDSVAEAIYHQISKDSSFNDFKKEEIEETIKGSKHYRATKNDEDQEIIDSDNMKLLVEDVFVQLENENIRNKPSEKKDASLKNKKETVSKGKKEDSKKVKKKEEKSEIQDLLDDDSGEIDFDEEGSDDDLGLKF